MDAGFVKKRYYTTLAEDGRLKLAVWPGDKWRAIDLGYAVQLPSQAGQEVLKLDVIMDSNHYAQWGKDAHDRLMSGLTDYGFDIDCPRSEGEASLDNRRHFHKDIQSRRRKRFELLELLYRKTVEQNEPTKEISIADLSLELGLYPKRKTDEMTEEEKDELFEKGKVTAAIVTRLQNEGLLKIHNKPNPYYDLGWVQITPQGIDAVEKAYCDMAEPQAQQPQRTTPARLYIDDIDSFAEVTHVTPVDVSDLLTEGGFLDLSEEHIQIALEQILNVQHHKKDWGGEINDFYTSNLMFQGRRVPTAFLLKGNGLRKREMHIADCGKNGDQIVRLFDSPAELFVVQFVGNIGEDIIRDVESKFRDRRAQGHNAWFCIIDGQDTARLLLAYDQLAK